MLSNACFLAKFRFDTAENEPAKNLQKLQNFENVANFAKRAPRREATAEELAVQAVEAAESIEPLVNKAKLDELKVRDDGPPGRNF